MNATAYLAGLGWKGEGHTLQPSGRGLKKPLLAAHKHDANGLGVRKHNAITSQWWLDSFDKSLKSFDVQNKTIITESPVRQAEVKNRQDTTQRVPSKYFDSVGLYARFVTGDGLKGTLGTTTCKSKVPAEVVERAAVLDTEAAQTTRSRKRRRRLESDDKDVDSSTSEFRCGLSKLEALSKPLSKKRHTKEVATGTEAEATRLKMYNPERLGDDWHKRIQLGALKEEKVEREKSDTAGRKVQVEGNLKRENRTTEASTTDAVYHVDTVIEEGSTCSAKSTKKKKRRKEEKKKRLGERRLRPNARSE